jgi:hypothetical protein
VKNSVFQILSLLKFHLSLLLTFATLYDTVAIFIVATAVRSVS